MNTMSLICERQSEKINQVSFATFEAALDLWTARRPTHLCRLVLVAHQPLCNGVDRVEDEELSNPRSPTAQQTGSRRLSLCSWWERGHCDCRLKGERGRRGKLGIGQRGLRRLYVSRQSRIAVQRLKRKLSQVCAADDAGKRVKSSQLDKARRRAAKKSCLDCPRPTPRCSRLATPSPPLRTRRAELTEPFLPGSLPSSLAANAPRCKGV